ncbi:MAG: N-6 DNA methylase, partial [Gemmatimonadetes bacterium]|nr:N-6 DNA methylase [Gemmatimonadota bacterium]
MARTRHGSGFTALRVEGGILPPEFLTEVAALQAPRQTGADYGLSESLSIKDEIARYWRIGTDLYSRYARRRPRHDLKASRVGVDDWIVPFLRSLLGYDDIAAATDVTLEERVFRLTHGACGGVVPLLLVTRDFDLDRADPRLGGNGRRLAPHALMQEYLNADAAALWGVISNGSRLRILRDNPSLTRPSYIEADLDLLFTEELYPDFAALWLAAHASRFRPANGKPSGCIIETWRTKAHETGERARDNLREGVTAALRQLGSGFLGHPANRQLREALDDGGLTPEDYFQQLLRLVYRMLFLFTAEERDLLHDPDATDRERVVYAEGYALSRLRERALRRRHYDRNSDLWQGIQVTFRALARGAPGLGLPALGGLYRDDQCPDLDKAAIANDHLLEAVRTLAFFPSLSGRSLARINYRDMDTEELGSVYESLLELQPVIDVHASPWRFAFAGDASGQRKTRGSARKLSGSYYTPPSLVGELVRTTLDPVIARAIADRPEDPRAAILDLRVLDPACGSGHFLLAAARRLAAEVASIDTDDDAPDEGTRRHALREVVQHCVYGVDRNPLAVELCKTALWIETIEPGKPLTFLDAHIALGDSLIGVLDPGILDDGIPAGAYKPLTGDDKGVCRDLRARNRSVGQGDLFFDEEAMLEVAIASIGLDAMPEETLDDVEAKRSAWEATGLDPVHAHEALRASLFAGAWFAPKTRRTLQTVPLTEHMRQKDSTELGLIGVARQTRDLASRHRFLHWHLRFPEIMQDGGFDAVLGNPPWEVQQLNEVEYFASRSPSIAELAGAKRKRAIADLQDGNPDLWEDFRNTLRGFEARNQYCRASGRYSLGNYGKLNSYALFAETFLQLINAKGRAGLILPTGIATDHSRRKFFEHVVNSRRLATLYDFENREKVFPGIDSRIKFCLLTLAGRDDPVPEAEFAFFLYQVEQLKERERRFTLSREDFKLFNPNTRTCPIFRTRRDMEIARKMYRRAGVFWKEKRGREPEENPWGVSFQQMFNMTSDSGLFRTRQRLEEDGWELHGNVFVHDDDDERYLPLYEAKLFHQYDHRFATFDGASERDIRNGNARPMTAVEKADPDLVVIPRYWVPETEVAQRLDKGEVSVSSIGRQAGRQAGRQ